MSADADVTLIPHSREAEEGVIGSVLLNPDSFTELHFLKQADFYIHRLGWIWAVFSSLHSQREPIDLLTVAEGLERKGWLSEAGGPAYLTLLVSRIESSLNAVSYGRIVEGYSIRRKLIHAANTIATLAYDNAQDVQAVIDQSLAQLYAAADRQQRKEMTIGLALSAAYDQSVEATRNENVIGIPTGFIDLDSFLSGLKPSKLYDVGGRPGRGKSALILDFAIEAAFERGKRVRLFSQEMDAVEIAIRVAAKRLRIDSKRIEDGDLTMHEWEQYGKIVEETQDYEKFPITVDETIPLTPLTLQAICQNEYLRGNLDLVIIDYAQLLQGEGASLREQITDVSRNMKRLARRLKIPVVAAVQLSRNAESGAPKLSDLQETGALEQDADVVLLLHEDKDVKNLVNVDIAKHRGGPVGRVQLVFKKELTKFENAARPEQRSF